jgi:hypothetical protein
MFDVLPKFFIHYATHSCTCIFYSKILRVSKSVFATDQALKAWFELVIIPRCNALGLLIPPLPELFSQLVADDMTVFVRDIYSPNALANESAWDADVRRVHGSFASIRQIARRDAGIPLGLNLLTSAHRQIVSESNIRRLAAGTPGIIPHNADSDLLVFDTNLLAYINFTDGEIDAQPKKGSKLHIWKQHQLSESEIRVHPGWIPRIAALRAVLALKPNNPRGPQGSNPKPRPIWSASKYAHIISHIRNGYPED